MQNSNKIPQGIAIPHSALLSVIFGMMIISFPLGAYVMFHSDLGGDINFEFPINNLGILSIGDGFSIFWVVYIIFFTIAMLGPKEEFFKTMSSLISKGKLKTDSNYMLIVTKWFSILILVSATINFIQEGFGISTVPPSVGNDLTQFFNISVAPIVEEISFRVVLIGLPLFAIYTHKTSIRYFLNCLWSPSKNLHVFDLKRVMFLITIVAIFFGLAHIISGEPWSMGKFAQATASGIILGWLYFRFGIITAILVHWATNYFIFSYVTFISQVNLISMETAFSHPLLTTMEILFLISGGLSIAILLINYFNSKKEHVLDV